MSPTKATSPDAAARRSAAAKKSAATRAARKEAAAAPAGLQVTDPASVITAELALGPGAPGPKPKSIVVENTLKCQTVDGEISLSLLVPYPKLKLLLTLEDDNIEEAEMVDYILENILSEADAATLNGLSDGTETFIFAIEWMTALGERLGSSVGKSGPSSS
ncbi:hypothetical protein [Arthrobacter sp. UYCu712]|uniref:hypothetical protein n=1 Tax=Arthrobacter sp. UYCu712 TaxID=3156340 RepID=UPI0033959688